MILNKLKYGWAQDGTTDLKSFLEDNFMYF